MDQPLAPDHFPGQANIEFVITVEVSQLFSSKVENRESVISPRPRALLNPEFIETLY
jgi:hypothetical protein